MTKAIKDNRKLVLVLKGKRLLSVTTPYMHPTLLGLHDISLQLTVVVVFRVPAWRLSIDFLPVLLAEVIYSYNLIGVQELWGTISTETCVMYYCHLHTKLHSDLVSVIYTADIAPLIKHILRKGKKNIYIYIKKLSKRFLGH